MSPPAGEPGPGADAPRPGEHWESVAAAWEKWWDTIEPGARPVSDSLVRLAALGPGQRVLDIASGIGEPAASAARAVGARGRVVATDIAPSMVARGRARARRLGLDNIEFRQMDAESPDLPAASFDAVLCRWGLMFVADLDRTLSALGGLLKPGGRLAAAVWAEPEKVPAIALATRILRAELDLPPPAPDARGPFELADVAALERRLEAAGFAPLEREPVSVVYSFPAAEAFVRFRQEVSSDAEAIADYPPARRAAAWRAVAEALAPYRMPDGRIVMANESISVAARRR